MIKKASLRSLCLLAVVTIAFMVCSTGNARATTFNPSNLMDDSVFDNTASMTAAQIDNWLNANFPNSCISTSHGFQARVPSGYSPSGGFTYGANGSAGQIIATAAQAYGLNPQVLLATVQKEQGLVSGSLGCSTRAYAGATGYSCSGASYNYSGLDLYTLNGVTVTSVSNACTNSSLKAGFSQQVIRAAWLFKFSQQRSLGNTSWAVINGSWDNSDDPQSCYSGAMTQGFRKRCASDPSATYYDGYSTVSGTSIHLDTGATVSLYRYTPDIGANHNFVSIFENWFGPVSGDAIGQYAYRLYNPGRHDHNFTAIENQRAGIKGLGYRDDGIAFKVSKTQEADMIPIYRMYNGRLTDYWMIPDGMNRYWAVVYGGYRDEGIAFYAYAANSGTSGPICSQGQAVFQMWHGGVGDHYYTTDAGARYWSLIYGGYIDDHSANYNSDWQGSSAFCVPY